MNKTLVAALCALAVLTCVLSPRRSAAQVALSQYQPAPLASDGFALGRPTLLAPLTWAMTVGVDYANDPLVYRLERGRRARQVAVADHAQVQLGAALGVHPRVMLFANLPIHVLMRGDPDLLVPNTKPDGAGLGDLTLAVRLALAGDDASRLALAGELLARLPTAQLVRPSQRYAGDEIGSYEAALLGEVRTRHVDTRVRVGARLRRAYTLQNLELGQMLVFGAGMVARLPAGITLHAELVGGTHLARAFRPQHFPLELLVGPKYQRARWWFGLAAGPGLVEGYGSPDVRVLFSAGFTGGPVQ